MLQPRYFLAAAALLIAVPAGAAAQKPPKPSKPPAASGPVSLIATPNPSVFSAPVALSGRVDKAGAGVQVRLESYSPPSTTFAAIATSQTDNSGKYRFTPRPASNTWYRVVASMSPPVTSASLLVRVRMLVGARVSDSTPARGSLVRFSGIVRPAHTGSLAYIQKRSPSGRWVTMARTTLRSLDAQSSRYSRRLRVRSSGTYRVKTLGHSDHAMGISRTRTLTVH